MVFGIVYSLFIGFSLTIGSDLYFFVDTEARHRREAATRYLLDQTSVHGMYQSDTTSRSGKFSFNSDAIPPPNSHYRQHGCYRDPEWGWYLQPFPTWAIWSLIPIFCTISALATFQPFRSRELAVMVFISCCSYAVDMVRSLPAFLPPEAQSFVGIQTRSRRSWRCGQRNGCIRDRCDGAPVQSDLGRDSCEFRSEPVFHFWMTLMSLVCRNVQRHRIPCSWQPQPSRRPCQ